MCGGIKLYWPLIHCLSHTSQLKIGPFLWSITNDREASECCDTDSNINKFNWSSDMKIARRFCSTHGWTKCESEKKYYTMWFTASCIIIAICTGGLGLIPYMPLWFCWIILRLVWPRTWYCSTCCEVV